MRKVNHKTVIAALLLFALSFTGTLAYVRAKDAKTNTFSVGENKIDIYEDFKPPKATEPGITAYKKQVAIENTGNTDAFVRVFMDFSNIESINHAFIATSQPSALSADTGKYTDGMSDADKEALKTQTENSIRAAGYKDYVDFWKEGGPDNDWVFVPEDGDDPELGGYFYYTKSVKPGQKTDDLIHSICTYYPDATDIKPYEVIVYAESVQVYDKDGNKFEDTQWKDAWKEFLGRKYVQ